MKSYSQSSEDLLILQYFGNYKGTLLEIGANNGTELSNSKLLIEQGWKAHLIEPGRTFSDLVKLHYTNPKVHLYNYAIGESESVTTFYESGAHVLGGADSGLVSSLDFDETLRWRNIGVDFTETTVQVKSFEDFYKEAGEPQLDFISIDAESHDWQILQQIDLRTVGCRCLCIEYNSLSYMEELFTTYCAGYKLLHKNRENLIFGL